MQALAIYISGGILLACIRAKKETMSISQGGEISADFLGIS
jgi:hypothetical protein